MQSFCRKFLVLIASFVLTASTWANNVEVVVTDQVIAADTIVLKLQVSWDNSWQESSVDNHDAVWLFFKSRSDAGWNTVFPFEIETSDFEWSTSILNTGVLLKSNETGTSFGELLVSFQGHLEISEISVSGIEMVLVDQGAFWLGDGWSNYSFTDRLGEVFQVDSESIIALSEIKTLSEVTVAGDIPLHFPKGFDAFYCMKYEISQQQWVSFFNHLTSTEQQVLFPELSKKSSGDLLFSDFAINSFNGIVISSPLENNQSATVQCDLNQNGVYFEDADGHTLACNYLSWLQMLYYLNWCGLRPMSELEFEKACRGGSLPLEGEYSFGSAQVKDANSLLLENTPYETHDEILTENEGIAVHGYFGRQGPLRVGFAANDTTSRLESGASYWGVMEMSGNLWEQAVSVSKVNGLSYQGNAGTGTFASFPSDWLEQSSIVRGGAWNSGIFSTYRDLAVSDRYYYGLQLEIGRNTTGGRGVISLKHLQ